MSEYSELAKEEIKRADHLFFVTLKYTRTADVMHNVIDRLVNACEIILNGFLITSKKIKSVPDTPIMKIQLLQKMSARTADAKKYVEFYIQIRKIKNATYANRGEYRKNVTLISNAEANKIEINTEKLREIYTTTIDLVNYFETLIESKKF